MNKIYIYILFLLGCNSSSHSEVETIIMNYSKSLLEEDQKIMALEHNFLEQQARNDWTLNDSYKGCYHASINIYEEYMYIYEKHEDLKIKIQEGFVSQYDTKNWSDSIQNHLNKIESFFSEICDNNFYGRSYNNKQHKTNILSYLTTIESYKSINLTDRKNQDIILNNSMLEIKYWTTLILDFIRMRCETRLSTYIGLVPILDINQCDCKIKDTSPLTYYMGIYMTPQLPQYEVKSISINTINCNTNFRYGVIPLDNCLSQFNIGDTLHIETLIRNPWTQRDTTLQKILVY